MRVEDCIIGLKVRLLDKTVPGYMLDSHTKKRTLWKQGYGFITSIPGNGSGTNGFNCIQVCSVEDGPGGDFYRPQDLTLFVERTVKARVKGWRKLIV